MRLTYRNILEVSITISTKRVILEEIGKYLKKVQSSKFKVQSEKIKPLIIYTPNPEIITFAQKDNEFKRIVNTAQINLPDGWGVVWAISHLYRINIKRVGGADFMLDICRLAAENTNRIGLIGADPEVAVATAECLLRDYRGIGVEVLDCPVVKIQNSKFKIQNVEDNFKYFGDLINTIKTKKIDIIFVALGFPKQEYFIENFKIQISNFKYNTPIVLMAVGGAFDYISGKVSRAPSWVRNLGFEWLYRLIREPWRLGRQIKGAKFFLDVLLNK